MKQSLLFWIIFLTTGVLIYTDPLPDWFISLRDAVYEQKLSAEEIQNLYRESKKQAEAALSGPSLYTMLSRCEYMMGRAYQYEERKTEAAARYEDGIAWAEKSLEEAPSSEGWQMLAENISQACAVKPASYAMANGLKVERYAKNALELNALNGAARYMLAARYVYAPPPFNNFKRGIQMMEDILAQNRGGLERDDLFNVYSAIGYAYVRQKKYGEAKPWLEKSLAVFPTNKFAGDMLKKGGA
ncbi:MAG: hypothetical protein LBP43_03040 [Treponema sp.]|jgi:tetratricopeptide (TPR) repeat protein|nr:hypothetical protein [Treponema sp.]